MVCVATDNDEVAKVATPDPLSGMALPITVEPSLKSTVPAGIPMEPDTVAVKLTDCPKTEGFCDELRLVAAGALFTVTVALVLAPSAAAKSEAARVCGAPPVQKVKLDRMPEPPASDRLPPAAPLSSPIAAAAADPPVDPWAAAPLVGVQSA